MYILLSLNLSLSLYIYIYVDILSPLRMLARAFRLS